MDVYVTSGHTNALLSTGRVIGVKVGIRRNGEYLLLVIIFPDFGGCGV
jgi:hypothetical protein